MIMLERISNHFSVDVMEAPATEKEILELKKFSSIEIPDEYIDLMRQATEMEIKVKERRYIRIWSLKGCIEMNNAYRIQSYIPSSLAIGDDEGGNAIIYGSGGEGFGLYAVSFSDLDISEAILIAPTLYDLLENNVGIEILLSL
jgi:hypothetical protein